jgi:hypothetical protein
MIRWRFFPGWVCLSLLVACHSPVEDALNTIGMLPDSLISEEKMVQMLTDAHLIESALLIAQNRGESLQDSAEFLYQGLYAKYGISHIRYQQNLAFYQQDPEAFSLLYDRVIKRLTMIESENVKQPPP